MYYVYILVDPRSLRPFYVGKGTGKRAQQHLWNVARSHNPYKENVIAAIRGDGYEPSVVFAYIDIADERLAYELEASLIRFWGRKGYDLHGILTNVCVDARPPSHRGKTYDQIYGVERAKAQIEKRAALQKQRGGYGPKLHSDATKLKISIKSSSRRGFIQSDACKDKIRQKAKLRVGENNKLSHRYELRSPDGRVHVCHGTTILKRFCKTNELSYATFHSQLRYGWPPARRGKNLGWILTRVEPEKD